MTGERGWTAPEMTPLVDDPGEPKLPAEDRRGALDQSSTDEPKPGEVPGLETRVEGRSRLGTTGELDERDAPDADDMPPHG
jgi:hypothetical protein